MTAFLATIAGIGGLTFGSFLGLVVYRVPRRESIMRPRSRCTNCGYELRVIDNIPVLSWLMLKGKCRGCSTKISARYPVAELTTAVLWALFVVHVGDCGPEATARPGCRGADVAPFLPFFWVLICLSLIDLEHKLIPNRILYPFLAAGFVLVAIAAAAGPNFGDLWRAVLAAAASFAVFNVIHFISPAGMGYGDVRLSALIGLHLGYLSWGHVYAGFLAGFLLGSVGGLALMALGKAGRKTAVPFGPFLAAGAVATVFWGDRIVALWQR